MSRMCTVGAISITPTVTKCAVTTLAEDVEPTSGHSRWVVKRDFEVSFVYASAWDDLLTPSPNSGISPVVEFFQKNGPIEAIGISMFGRVDTEERLFLGSSFDGWCYEPGVTKSFAEMVPFIDPSQIFVHNDSTIDAIAEFTVQKNAGENAAKLQDMVYIKADFGIGAGVILKGRPWQGGLHPEPGHQAAVRYAGDDLPSVCRPHNEIPCIMGVASLEALGKRLELLSGDTYPDNLLPKQGHMGGAVSDPLDSVQAALDNLESDHLIWEQEADYLAQLCMLMTSTIAPRWVVLGGRVLRTTDGKPRKALYKKIRDRFVAMNGVFPQYWGTASGRHKTMYIQAPKWNYSKVDQSLCGAFELLCLKLEDGEIRVADGKKLPAAPQNITGGRLFGLIIDERIQWVSAQVKDQFNLKDIEYESGKIDISVEKPFQNELRTYLEKLKKDRPTLFSGVSGVGVSAIGVVDTNQSFLVSIARKGWVTLAPKTGGKRPNVVEFKNLFTDMFSGPEGQAFNLDSGLVVQNDASAKALAEYFIMNKNDRRSTLMYLMFCEGVNGGIVRANESLTSERHPEMGHIIPYMHQLDYKGRGNFSLEKTGCPVHKICFEGLVSRARLRNSWRRKADGQPVESMGDLLDEPNHPAWEIVPFYIAQLCMVGLLTIGPKKILVSGSILDEEGQALEKARAEFQLLNNEYLPHLNAREVRSFIEKASFSSVEVAIRSALVMAWMAASGNKRTSFEKSANVVSLFGNLQN